MQNNANHFCGLSALSTKLLSTAFMTLHNLDSVQLSPSSPHSHLVLHVSLITNGSHSRMHVLPCCLVAHLALHNFFLECFSISLADPYSINFCKISELDSESNSLKKRQLRLNLLHPDLFIY